MESTCPRAARPIAETVDRSADYDVVILGAAFSAAASALLLKRTFPDLRILLVERTEEFDRKVGESTSEVAACFLTRVLNLGMHLSSQHVPKSGLRMWFQKDGNEDPGRCTETGPTFQGRLPAFQLNRIKLDNELLSQVLDLGCELARPATIKSLQLDGIGKNSLTIHPKDGDPRTVTATWIVDASGKAAQIARLRKTWRSNAEEHPTSAMWTRFTNVCYLDSAEGRRRLATASHKVLTQRGNATNHLTGKGWWCWIIPLDNGEVSAGLTWDRRLFTPPEGDSYAERVHKHLLEHPVGKLMFGDAQPVENDSRYYKNPAYYSEEVAGPGFTIVGDAAGFMDPLYSQGLDYCAHSIYSSYDLLRNFYSGQCIEAPLARKNAEFKQSYFRWFRSLYKDKYWYLGDSELMSAAYLMDIATYFIGPVRLVHTAEDMEFSKMPYDGPIGGAFARFMSFYNKRLAILARKKLANNTYGEKNVDHDFLFSKGFSPDTASLKLLFRGLRTWLASELRLLTVRPVPTPEGEPKPRNQEHAETHGQQHAQAA